MAELKLTKPVDINGEKKKVIKYDLENLRGDSLENAIKELQKAGYVPTVQETDPLLHAHIFAEAAGIDYTDVRRLSLKDYMKATGVVRDFFFEDSEDSPQENTSEQ